MADGRSASRWRSAVAVTTAAAVLAGVGWAAVQPSTVAAQFDIDQARANLAAYVAANPPLPPGSAEPPDGPPCPLATPEQLADSADIPLTVAPWYSYTAIDSQLQS